MQIVQRDSRFGQRLYRPVVPFRCPVEPTGRKRLVCRIAALRHSTTPRRSIEVRAQCNRAGCRIAVLGHIGGLSCCT